MNEENINYHICPNCFYKWQKEASNDSHRKIVTHCEYCSDKSPMSEFDRVDRYVSIIKNTDLKNFAGMLPKIWKIIKDIKSEIEDIKEQQKHTLSSMEKLTIILPGMWEIIKKLK